MSSRSRSTACLKVRRVAAPGAIGSARMTRETGAPGSPPLSAHTAFEVPDDVVYLNCASLAPRLKRVTVAGHAAVDRMAAPWNIHAPDWFRETRLLAGAFARLIAAPAECAVLVPSVSYGLAAAARTLPVAAGENLVVIDQEYPSNYYSWRRLADANRAQMRPRARGG